MEPLKSTLRIEDLSEEEIGLLRRIIELGEVFEFFGARGQQWAFPRPGTKYVDTLSISKNILFERIKQAGLIESRHTSSIQITALIWSPTEKAKTIAKEKNWITKRGLPHSISRVNRIDQAKALGATIRAKDPKMKNAFTPEVAEKLS